MSPRITKIYSLLPPTFQFTWTTLAKIQKCLEIQPCQPCIIDRKVYFSFNLTVVLNPKYDVFDLGTMQSQAEMIHECTKEGGGGLNCILDATDTHLLIKFHYLIDHPFQFMFWSLTNSNSQNKVIKKKLHSARHDVERLPYVTMWYLQEYHGDATPTVQIIITTLCWYKQQKQKRFTTTHNEEREGKKKKIPKKKQ